MAVDQIEFLKNVSKQSGKCDSLAAVVVSLSLFAVGGFVWFHVHDLV